ncbi:alpha/beta hydrolase [Tomitella fengzijianii]|uniref:Alpha/beta hydrolase n=1 Tax=Tomitella fengzijianii TaxID=2597660 RepID=A0A516X6U3_9ACTN|nr:alpha/beta hydrolase [Tomitella fengzijianii]QDQ98794.1 alpha/beta hydrolase [Tomitella fengzijianii]
MSTDTALAPDHNHHAGDPAAILETLPPERRGEAAAPDLIAKREGFTDSGGDASVPYSDDTFGSVPCRTLTAGDDVIVLYLHGGGYRLGNVAGYTPYASRLARSANATLVLAEYRLAPESPFPAAVRDAVEVFLALRERHPRAPMVVAGDSAGGGLSAALSVAMSGVGAAGPDGLALLSPWLDLRCDSPTYDSATDPLFDRATAQAAGSAYLQGHRSDDPLVSPLRADPSGFPHTLIQVGTNETLLGDALAFSHRLASEGIPCTLQTYAGRGHTWPLIEPDIPDSAIAVDEFGRFTRRIAETVPRLAIDRQDPGGDR